MVLFAGLVYLGYYVFTETNIFVIDHVNLMGNIHVSRQEIESYLDMEEGIHYFDMNPYDLKTRLENHSWIKSCQVEKVLPNRLNVSIVERVPVIAVYWAESYLWLDEELYVVEVVGDSGKYYPVTGFELNSFNKGKRISALNWKLLSNCVNLVYFLEFVEFDHALEAPEIMIEDDNIMLYFTDQFKANLGDGDNLTHRFNEVKDIYATLLKESGYDILKVRGTIVANHDSDASFIPFGE